MKANQNIKRLALISALGAVLAMPVLAQPGAGMGNAAGRGACMQNSAQTAGCAGQGTQQGMQQGMRKGMRQGRQGMAGQQNQATGRALMTAEERSAQQAKMRAVKTYAECTQVQSAQRSLMTERAKEKGLSLPTPRQSACDNMKARGFIQ